MLIQDYFAEQVSQLRNFIDNPESGVRILGVAPELVPMVERLLAKIDALDENPHVIQAVVGDFENADSYALHVLSVLESSNEQYRDELGEGGVDLPKPKSSGKPIARLADYVQRVSESLPPAIGNIVILLHPKSVHDAGDLLKLVASLGRLTTPPIVKWLLFVEDDVIPEDFPPDHPLLSLQRWHHSSAEVQQGVVEELERDDLPDEERTRLTTMAAGMATAEGDVPSAEKLHRYGIELSKKNKDKVSQASGHYQLGNALLAQEKFAEAEEHFCHTVMLAVENETHQLAGIGMAHLGICLCQLGRLDEGRGSI